MNKSIMKKLLLLLIIPFLSFGQNLPGVQILEAIIPIGNVANFLITQDVLEDATVSMEAYMAPFGKSIGTGLNAGWYNTGKPHRFPGFDITIGGHAILMPSEAKEPFTFETEPNVVVPVLNNTIASEWDVFYMPYLQGSIGLIHKTELLFRYLPPMTYSDITANYWGLGIKHDFKQYIPVIGALPFDLSFLAAYSNFKSNYHYTTDFPGFLDHNRYLDFDVEAFNCNIILSKKLAFITTYAGAGYQYSTSNLILDGYVIKNNNKVGDIFVQNPPLNVSLGGVNGVKANVGARFKFLLFTVHVDYTIAEYNAFTVGIGLNSDIGSKIIGGGIEKTTKKKNRD